MKFNKLYLFAALMGTVLAGCQKTEEETQNPVEEPAVEQGWKLTVKARISNDTRAMSVGSVTDAQGTHDIVNTYWKAGEKADVYVDNHLLGTLEVESVDNGIATLTGDDIMIKEEETTLVAENSVLTLLFPSREDHSWTYLGQDGSAPSEDGTMATGFDYSTAALKVTSMNAGTINTVGYNPDTEQEDEAPTFKPEQSIYRVSFKDKGNENALVSVKSLTISSGQGKLVRNRTLGSTGWATQSEDFGALTLKPTVTPNDGIYWMAIRNESTSDDDDSYTFTIVDNANKLFIVDKTIPASVLTNATFISAKNIKVQQKAFAPESSGTISSSTDVL